MTRISISAKKQVAGRRNKIPVKQEYGLHHKMKQTQHIQIIHDFWLTQRGRERAKEHMEETFRKNKTTKYEPLHQVPSARKTK